MTDALTGSMGVVALDDPAGLDPDLVGGKAAALVRAAHAGLPVFDAMVLTTVFTAEVDRGRPVAGHPALDTVIAHFGDRPLVVRSSSTVEDLAESSMAGRFESVLDVTGRAALEAAVTTVLGSRQRATHGTDLAADHPIAVLVQPFSRAQTGGVLFGIDPVTGRSDRLVAVAGDDPEEIVSGAVDGTRNEMDLDGAVTDDAGAATLPGSLRRALAELARQTSATFGGPQDVEWLLDEEGVLRLLQSRPVTTLSRGVPVGPLYGPGPVAETFPDALSPLERDLWVPPLREAMKEALVLAGVATHDDLAERPVVVAPGGRVAVDLEITGELPPARLTLLGRVNPMPALRRVRSAWRFGRLRAALPELAMDVLDRTDQELRGVVAVEDLSDRQLVALLERSQRVLVSVHAHEILMGLVVDPEAPEITGASVALRVLGEARRDCHDDARIVRDNPVVLALAPPRVQAQVVLPQTPEHLPPAARSREKAGVAGLRREALRLRARWIQELSARAAWEIACRMAREGRIERPEDARQLSLDEMRMIFLRWSSTSGPAPHPIDPDPLPGTFQLSDLGLPIRVRRVGVADEAVGAGGGSGEGAVSHDQIDPPTGSVLVVTTLRPDLAPVLGRLSGLVSETGSPLAHLAILAREAGVATVVGVDDAVTRFPEGTSLLVDGVSGQIKVLDPPSHPTPGQEGTS